MATVTLSNSIIANSPSGAQCENDLTLLIENGNNWFEDASCNGVAQGDPKLGPLQNNGGPGKSHAPLAGSGVIDAADNTICAAQPINNEDQRGRARPVGDACDIGAIEDAGESFYVIPLANGKSVIIVL